MPGPPPANPADLHFADRPLVRLGMLLGVCGIIYWAGLGSSGFSMSEGHRVVPALEMIESGDFRVMRMFGEVYFRKPPGMMWAIAASSWLFGHTELSARAVSAAACTLMALAAWAFTRRRWGPLAGLLAGILQAATPLMWEAGRSAEIEALHTLGVQLACLGLIDLALPPPASPTPPTSPTSPTPRKFRAGAACAVGTLLALLAKGPAGLPAVAATLVALAMVRKPTRPNDPPARLAPALSVLLAALLASGAVLWWVARGVAAAGPAVTQSPGEFLWDPAKLGSILTLPLTGLAAALPGSLVVFALPGLLRRTEDRAALALTAAGLLATLAYAALGVSNPRYTMPAAPLWPPALAAVAVAGLFRAGRGKLAIEGTLLLAPAVMAAGLIATQMSENARRGDGGRGSGRPAGEAIGRVLATTPGLSPMELWADGAVEARPEVLLYARRAALEAGLDLRPRWSSTLLRPFLPPPKACVLVRVEGEVREGGEAVAAGRATLWRGRAGKFELMVLGPVTTPEAVPGRAN